MYMRKEIYLRRKVTPIENRMRKSPVVFTIWASVFFSLYWIRTHICLLTVKCMFLHQGWTRWPFQGGPCRKLPQTGQGWRSQNTEKSKLMKILSSLKSKLFDHLMKRKDESSDLWWELGEEKGSETENPLAAEKQSCQKTNPAERRKTLISDF